MSRIFLGARRGPEPEPLFEAAVHELVDLRIQRVERKDSALWNEYIDRYHYLGYKPLPGAQLRYFAYTGDCLLGLLGFGAAAWKTGPRDAWIGWSRAQRHRNLRRCGQQRAVFDIALGSRALSGQ